MQRTIAIAAGDPVFDGHFPGRPMLPGARLLDRVIEALRQADDRLCDAPLEITVAKFLVPVLPGQQVRLQWTAGTTGLIKFECFVDQTMVATGALRPAPDPDAGFVPRA